MYRPVINKVVQLQTSGLKNHTTICLLKIIVNQIFSRYYKNIDSIIMSRSFRSCDNYLTSVKIISLGVPFS